MSFIDKASSLHIYRLFVLLIACIHIDIQHPIIYCNMRSVAFSTFFPRHDINRDSETSAAGSAVIKWQIFHRATNRQERERERERKREQESEEGKVSKWWPCKKDSGFIHRNLASTALSMFCERPSSGHSSSFPADVFVRPAKTRNSTLLGAI